MKKLSIFNFKFLSQKGFSLVELLISVTIFAILVVIVTLNLNTAQHNTSINSSVDTLLADLSQQQIKAMVGDTEGRTTHDNYGVFFSGSDYTLFHGTYSGSEPSNFTISFPEVQQVSTTFANSQVIFQKGSGNLLNYVSNQNSITITDTVSGESKTLRLNRYGIITSIN